MLDTPATITGIPLGAGAADEIQFNVETRDPVPHEGEAHTYLIDLVQLTGGEEVGGATISVKARALDTDTDGDGQRDIDDDDDDGDGVPDDEDMDPADRNVGRVAPATCTIDLVRGQHDCEDIEAITFIEEVAEEMAVVKVTLDPDTTGYERALFDVRFNDEPAGWTVNIGDSESNDGSGGDAGDQSNSAEMQKHDGTVQIFGNDDVSPDDILLATVEDETGAESTLQLEVGDGRLGWKSPGISNELRSEYLYALSGQADSEGPVNYDVYAAFNRTIGSADRTGSGVGRVGVTLIPRAPIGTPVADTIYFPAAP